MFIYAPILLLVVYSFTTSKVIGKWEGGFSFELYGQLFRNAEIMQILFNTVWLALAAAALSTVLGTRAPSVSFTAAGVRQSPCRRFRRSP